MEFCYNSLNTCVLESPCDLDCAHYWDSNTMDMSGKQVAWPSQPVCLRDSECLKKELILIEQEARLKAVAIKGEQCCWV